MSHGPSRVAALGLTTLLLAGASLSAGCRNRKNLAEHAMDDPASELGSARCGGDGRIVRPLIIEWPATDRASLEGRLQRGLVVVRYEGCVVEVLRECRAPSTAEAPLGYDYLGITRKSDSLTIRSADELYANMPLTAVKLEAKLAKAGELNVAMALVGNYEAQRARFDIRELEGRCDGATHVIAAAQVGAFEFYAGAGAEIAAGVEAESVVGVGGRSSASREVINKDGQAEACERSTPGDAGPPAECGALLRLELTALDGIVPTCQPGQSWNGSACVDPVEYQAQAQTQPQPNPAGDPGAGGQPAQPGAGGSTPAADLSGEDDQIAWRICEVQMQCNAESMGVEPPEGQAYQKQMQRCAKVNARFINDYSRPQARKCLDEAAEGSCAEFESCLSGPDLDDDEDW